MTDALRLHIPVIHARGPGTTSDHPQASASMTVLIHCEQCGGEGVERDPVWVQIEALRWRLGHDETVAADLYPLARAAVEVQLENLEAKTEELEAERPSEEVPCSRCRGLRVEIAPEAIPLAEFVRFVIAARDAGVPL